MRGPECLEGGRGGVVVESSDVRKPVHRRRRRTLWENPNLEGDGGRLVSLRTTQGMSIVYFGGNVRGKSEGETTHSTGN